MPFIITFLVFLEVIFSTDSHILLFNVCEFKLSAGTQFTLQQHTDYDKSGKENVSGANWTECICNFNSILRGSRVFVLCAFLYLN